MAAPLLAKVRGRSPQQVVQAARHKLPSLRATYHGYHRCRYWEPMWYHVLNRAGKAEWLRRRVELDSVQRRVLEEFRREGICRISLGELTDDESLLPSLQYEAETVLASPENAEQLAEGRARMGEKDFLVRALGGVPLVNPQSKLAMLALNQRILDVVAECLQLAPRLRAFDLWCTLPVDPDQPPVLSQRWHRDYDNHRLVKMFVYLVDVDESMGFFSYVRGSHSRGPYANVLPTKPPRGSNPPAGAVEAAVPATQITRCTGKAGTVVLCDTNGLHQGGRSTTVPRVLLMANYASDAANAPYLLRLAETESYGDLSPSAEFALRLR